MSLNIVLIEPEIPNNTGNIGRLSLATGAKLHLIKPLGFDLDEKRVRRAGLDYWKNVDLHVYEDFNDFLYKNGKAQLAFFSSHGKKALWSLKYQKDMFLVFGKESVGLSREIKTTYNEQLYSIPINTDHVRSLNLANAVSVVIYEGLRQLK